MKKNILDLIEKAIHELRAKKSLVLNITNFVTPDFIANCVLALGGSPVMSKDEEDATELMKLSVAVNINIGTVGVDSKHLYINIAKKTHEAGKLVLLDPVGAGATRIRTKTAQNILPYVSVIKGNASEIASVAGIDGHTKGVDSTEKIESVKDAAEQMAKKYNCVVFVTGKEDFITDGSKNESIKYGSSMMSLVTGTGCSLGAMIAAFSSVTADAFEASVFAGYYYTLCAEQAAKISKGSASFKVNMIDAIYEANFQTLKEIYAS